MLKQWIAEIEKRNAFRALAGLPLLSVPQELRKTRTAKRARDRAEFLRTSPLRKSIEEELLAEVRLRRRDPHWKPSGMLSGGGWGFASEVNKRLLKYFPFK